MAARVPVTVNEPVRSHRHCARRAFKRDLINTFCVNRHKRFPRLAALDNRDRDWPRFAPQLLRTLVTPRASLVPVQSFVPVGAACRRINRNQGALSGIRCLVTAMNDTISTGDGSIRDATDKQRFSV